MTKKIFFFFIFFFTCASFSQENLEKSLETAFNNAKKGVYWALENIPLKKKSLENDLIINDVLISSVKLTRESEGVKIVSQGYYLSNAVEVITYKSFNNLIIEGYLKAEEENRPPAE